MLHLYLGPPAENYDPIGLLRQKREIQDQINNLKHTAQTELPNTTFEKKFKALQAIVNKLQKRTRKTLNNRSIPQIFHGKLSDKQKKEFNTFKTQTEKEHKKLARNMLLFFHPNKNPQLRNLSLDMSFIRRFDYARQENLEMLFKIGLYKQLVEGKAAGGQNSSSNRLS